MKGYRDHDELRDLLLKLMIIIVQISTRMMEEFANNYFPFTNIGLSGMWSYNIHMYIHLHMEKDPLMCTKT